MNAATQDLIERPYREVVDDLLTALVGGVVNEPVLFDVKTDFYPLAEPARAVRAITGFLGRERHEFLPEVDFSFSEGDNAVIWLEGGERPDDDTPFYVDYYRRESRSPLSDLNIGSVTRTLAEAVGREITTVYQQIRLAHLAGFIDTAAGKSLDLVVSILGVERKTGELAEGLVSFFRDPAVQGNVHVPQGTRLTTAKGEVGFETTQPRMLQQGQARIDAPVRAGSDFAAGAGLVDAGAISIMASPLAGIARVSNLEPTVKAAEDESDEELRLRARSQLRSLGKATLAALDRVIREGRGLPLEWWDPSMPPGKRSDPGTVTLLVEAEPERLPGLQAAVQQTRAAGVVATVIARHVYCKPYVTAEIPAGLTAAGKKKIQHEMIAALQGYIDGLGSGEPAEGPQMLTALESVADVGKVRFRDVLAWRSEVDSTGSESLLDGLVAAVESVEDAGPDLRETLSEVLREEGRSAPTGRRILDRRLVRSSSGASAGASELAEGELRVIAELDGEPWWISLDMEPSDIVLVEKGG